MTRTFKTLTASAFVVGLALAMPTAASADWTDPAWPNADIAVAGISYTGLPTGFDALSSAGGDTGGLQFEYDFDNDGVFDLTTDVAVALHTYDTVGPQTATVRVTDLDFDATSVASVRFDVVDISEIGPPLSPSDGAAPAIGVAIDRHKVMPGDRVRLTLASGGRPLGYVARLVPASDADPWFQKSVQDFGPLRGKSAGLLTLDVETKPGRYKLLVTTHAHAMAEFAITVQDPAPSIERSRRAQSQALVIGGAVAAATVTLALVALVVSRRRRRTTSVTAKPESGTR